MVGRRTMELNQKTRMLGGWVTFGLVGVGLWFAVASEDAITNNGGDVSIEIRAQRFVVVDETGTERARFGILEHGEPGMIIWTKKKTAALTATIDRLGGPRVTLTERGGEDLLTLGIANDRHPLLVMTDETGRRRLVIMAGTGAGASVGLYDAQQRNRCTIALRESGEPEITLKDAQERIRGDFMMDQNGTVALALWDRNREARVVFQINPENIADAAVFGVDGVPIWSASNP